jgi:hypothetical protein
VDRSILGFLFESKLVAVTALSLSAISSLEGKSSITLSADFLVAVEFLGDSSDGGIHNTSSKSEDEMESGLFLDVIVGETSSVYFKSRIPSSCLPAKMSLC